MDMNQQQQQLQDRKKTIYLGIQNQNGERQAGTGDIQVWTTQFQCNYFK